MAISGQKPMWNSVTRVGVKSIFATRGLGTAIKDAFATKDPDLFCQKCGGRKVNQSGVMRCLACSNDYQRKRSEARRAAGIKCEYQKVSATCKGCGRRKKKRKDGKRYCPCTGKKISQTIRAENKRLRNILSILD